MDVLTDTVTSYIRFCEDLTIQTKTLKIFPNSKPWVTSELKQKIKEKHRFRLSNNKEEMKRVQKELNVLIHKCKVDYKSKIEKRFESNNIRAAWDGLKTITGYFKKSVEFPSDNLAKLANELNKFYCRFDVSNRDAIPSIPCDSVMDVPCEITKEEIALRKINVRKACGPDGLSPRLLNVCSLELCDIFHILFNESVFSGEIPYLWKTAIIIPVPKISKPIELNDYRPVALTAVVMKCLERIVLGRLMQVVSPKMDGLQFAYRKSRSVEDATLTMLNKIYQHLDKQGSCVRALFVDFSSAFNTILPQVIIQKPINLNVPPYLCSWISDFLTGRKQRVCISQQGRTEVSNTLEVNTGAPQGCVLSPALFTVYTNDCMAGSENCTIIKYADDTVLLGLILNDDEEAYRDEIVIMTEWCRKHNLLLNVKKTKEIVFDFRKRQNVINQICIGNDGVEIVNKYNTWEL